ncbi:hypothetical protein GALMADRAFT_146749 [Galerina marginata CBS 339.88]|uniref:Uncharacterized protein n=1 Tax=Galerina marginata (strain CBS 339.88) TaxID=685588 RepID=A0A067SAS7_GALM3|nr:hypothetical protein GALMADRAFT_146749 [Galerina marginata CBS 339.88]
MAAPVYLLENTVTSRGDKRSSSHSRLMYSLPPVSVGPIYLSWDEQAPILSIEEHEVDSPVDPSRNAREVSLPRQLLPELPPSCKTGHMRESDVTYTFSFPSSWSTTGASMLVIPPSQWSTTSPIYRIIVGQHPFLPTCQITSVFKGANDDGLYIGGFK